MSRIILGVDPGLTRCGWGIIEAKANSSKMLAMGVIQTPPTDATPARLCALLKGFTDLFIEHTIEEVGVEQVFTKNNLQSATGVTQAAGIVLALAHKNKCPATYYTPAHIKKVVTNDGTANKVQIQKMVKLLLGITDHIRPPDIADALAVALTCGAHPAVKYVP